MLIAVLALATYYVTYVVTRSSLPPVKWARRTIETRWDGHSIAYLVNCPWCAGFWVACAIVGVTAWVDSVPWPVAVVFACAGVAGVVQHAVDVADEVIELVALRDSDK